MATTIQQASTGSPSVTTQSNTIDGNIRKILMDILTNPDFISLCEYDTTNAFVECKNPQISDNKMLITLRGYVWVFSGILTSLITIIIYYIGTGEDLPDNGKNWMIGLGCGCIWMIFGFLFFNSRVKKL